VQRNHLASETSPYLAQHADNPVDWYPWSEAALALAKREDKPILLSVGYSACHWCHVMAHESFEDKDTAALMNRLFVNIKVDREERPDLDKIYQVAQQLLTQRSGGWPLTMFLTPDDQQPFFGGTYFPKEARYGMPSFQEILQRVAAYFRDNRAAIRAQSGRLAEAFQTISSAREGPPAALDDTPLALARTALARSFDPRYGGFGAAPKFPHPGSIERCLRDAAHDARPARPIADGGALRDTHGEIRREPSPVAASGAGAALPPLAIAVTTLTRMAEGGIYDQLAGGFARYSVDDSWTIPHFEKMLYDNGQLLGTYALAAASTGDKALARVTSETADWLLRDMRSPEGGFYSSLDADSEGHEGKFYVWTRAEVRTLLDEREYTAFAPRFGLDQEPNFEGEWHLCIRAPLERAEDTALIDAARAKLLAARTLRVWPGRDEKILTAWNALTVRGLALASRALHRPDLADAATATVDFIHRTLWRDGRLLATYKDGRAHLHAYLDDHAFLADALLELLQARWRARDLEFARDLAEVMLDRFADPVPGGFFFTASDHERLIHRSKTFSDESLPAGNGVAASVLCRLGFLLGEKRYLEAAEGTLKAGFGLMREYPEAHMSMLAALEELRAPLEIVILRGAEARRWAKTVGRTLAPARMVLAIPSDAPDLPPTLAAKHIPGATAAFICRGMTCSAPLTDLGELVSALPQPSIMAAAR
jgi:uncharacterized protein